MSAYVQQFAIYKRIHSLPLRKHFNCSGIYFFTSKSSSSLNARWLELPRSSGEPISSISPESKTLTRSSSSSFSVSETISVVLGSSISASGAVVVSSSDAPSVVSTFGLTSTVRTLKITCPKSLCCTWTVSLMMNLWSPTTCAITFELNLQRNDKLSNDLLEINNLLP